MKEDTLRNWFRKITPKLAEYQRLEDKYSRDIPDVSVCYQTEKFHCTDFWVELKSVGVPDSYYSPIDIGLRAGQASWLLGRHIRGGRAYILLQLCLDNGRYERLLFSAEYGTALTKKQSINDLRNVAIAKDKKIKEYLYARV